MVVQKGGVTSGGVESVADGFVLQNHWLMVRVEILVSVRGFCCS